MNNPSNDPNFTNSSFQHQIRNTYTTCDSEIFMNNQQICARYDRNRIETNN